MPREGQMGTAPDGTRVIWRGGRAVPVDSIKLTEDQGKAQDFARQMATAEKQYLEAREAGFDPTSWRNAVAAMAENFKIPLPGTDPAPFSALAPALRDDASDKGVAAQKAWLDARLKAMTGAGQSAPEMLENPRTYFPQPGENGTWGSKYDIRREAYKSTRTRSGPAAAMLSEEYPNPAKLPKRKSVKERINAAIGEPVKVNSPAEAEKLAPGTVFITPDGRRKVR